MRAVLAVFLAVMLLAGAPSEAGAAYAYNYGFDWSQSPFLDNNYISHASIAKYWQGVHGYTARAYSSSWAGNVYSNMSAVSVMYMSGHSNAGFFPCWNDVPRTWSAGGETYTSHVSCITHGYTHYGTHAINGRRERCNHSRLLSNLNGSPIRIMMFRGCYTANGGLESLPYRAVHTADMDFAGGFTTEVYSFTTSGRTPGYDWSYKYWSALNSHYCAYYSMVKAKSYVWSLWENYYGYDNIGYQGDASVLM